MRISTNTMYDIGVARITELQAGLVKTQQQISTNRRMLSPADDPIASARALEISQGKEINAQLGVNRQNARQALAQQEGVLASVSALVQDVQTLAVSAGNGALDDTQRRYLAVDLQSRYDQMLGLANSRDGTGNYMFAGFDITAEPFGATPQGAVYRGDQGQRSLQIGAGRQINVSNAGNEVFERIRGGNGSFVTAPAATNQGSGVVGIGSVTDISALTAHDYKIDFHNTAGVMTYDVTDTSAGLPALSSGNTYNAGDAISFDGLQFDVRGAPAEGDSFSVAPCRNESIFTTLRELIGVLSQPSKGVPEQARLLNGLVRGGAALGGMLDNVLTLRASLGGRLKELDSLDTAGSERDVQFAQSLSDLQDVDYVKAISDLTQQQTTLEAAQKSFMMVSSLSLFKLI
jgi:flagellar hook-associated protein 3 FlgL